MKVDSSIVLVRQNLRQLPLSVRAAVSDKLKRLLAAGVIEPFDVFAWVLSIVVRPKSGRMCADLREPNEAVIIDAVPLQSNDEWNYFPA